MASLRRKTIATAVVSAILAVVAWFSLVVIDWSRSSMIEFILPDSFDGRIVIREDAQGEIAATSKERYIIRVSDNGQVILRDTSMFTKWHKLIACRESGMPVSTINQPVGDGDVALRLVGMNSESRVILFLGSYDAFVREQVTHGLRNE
jgi:hypothetical protein